jgi:hypothetical protein
MIEKYQKQIFIGIGQGTRNQALGTSYFLPSQFKTLPEVDFTHMFIIGEFL